MDQHGQLQEDTMCGLDLGCQAGLDRIEVRLRLRRMAETAGTVRRVAEGVLAMTGAGHQARDELCLAVGEACANAVRHAGVAGDYEVLLQADGGSCEIQISDRGLGFDMAALPLATLDATGGRGIAMMRLLVDRFDIQSAVGQGTTVRLLKRFNRTSPPPAASDPQSPPMKNCQSPAAVIPTR